MLLARHPGIPLAGTRARQVVGFTQGPLSERAQPGGGAPGADGRQSPIVLAMEIREGGEKTGRGTIKRD